MTTAFIVHGGLGKTATTWLQTVALRHSNVKMLGKGGRKDGSERHANEQLRDLQHAVFSPIYHPNNMWRRYRNSVALVQEYGDEIISEIESDTLAGNSVVVLSDETLLTYGGLEVNVAPMVVLVDHLMKNFSRSGELQLEFVITIREQSSFLTSYYAYDYANLKSLFPSFDSFLDAGITDPTAGVFGLLLYDKLYSMLRSALPDNVNIRFVPYETLPAYGGSRYLEEFLGPDAWKRLVLAREISDEAVLENVDHHLRDQDSVRVFINRLRNLRPSSKYGRMPVFKALSSIARSRIALAAVPAESTRIREESIRMTGNQETEVRNLYAMSNRRIDEVLGLGLSALGYSLNPRK